MKKSRMLLSVVLALFCASPLWSATELLRNGNFKKISPAGLPIAWEARELTAKVTGDTVKLDGKGFFVHSAMPMKEGESYVLSFEVRSASAAKYIAYCEWSTNGQFPSCASDLTVQTAPAEWTPVVINFVYGNSPQEPHRAIMAITLPEGGSAEFRKLSLMSLAADESGKGNLLRNGDFALVDAKGAPMGWEQAGVTAKKNGEKSVLLKGSGFFVNRGLKLKPNQKYLIRWEVRCAQSTPYRLYSEWCMKRNDKEYHTSGYDLRASSPEWQAGECSFTYEPDASLAYLAIGPTDENGEIEFRNVTLEELDMNRGSGMKALGGEWFLMPPAKVKQVKDKEAIFVQTGSSTESNAILRGAAVKPGKFYTLSYRTQSANPAISNGDSFSVEVLFDGVKENVRSPWDDTWTNSFQNKNMTFKVPEQCTGKAEIRLYSGAAQPVYFADFELTESEIPAVEAHPVVLSKPFYRNKIYASMPVDTIEGAVKTGKAVKSVKVRLISDNKTLFEKVWPNRGEEVAFAIPAADLAAGDYQIEAVCDNEKPSVLGLSKLEKAPVEVVAGSDNIFRINGKPFFPVLLWENSLSGISEDEKFYTYGHNGFNLFFSRAGDELALLDQLNLAEKNHVKIILMAGIPKPGDESLKNWQHHMANLLSDEVLAHPALFGYFLEDEIMWNGQSISLLKNAHDYLTMLDPYRPTWVNEAPRGTVEGQRQYSQHAEIWGVDIYPVGSDSHSGLEDKTLSCIGKYVKWLDEVVENRKPVWMTLQGFAWQSLDNNDDGTGYPTRLQNRYAIFDTLVEGGEGLVWWGSVFVKTPEFYDVLFDGAREVHALSGLLVNGKTLNKVVSSNPAVRTRLLEMDGKRYLLAVNGTKESVTVTLNAGFQAQKVTVLPEKRTITVKNGAIADTIEAYGSRCYAEAALPAPAWELAPENPAYPQHPARTLKALRDGKPYAGKANWIWDPATVKTQWGKAVLQKEVNVKGKLCKANLVVSVDDTGIISINGEKVTTTEMFLVAVNIDCTKRLKNGKNVITIDAKDGGQLPCGALAELTLEYANGQKEVILSDTSWTCESGANAVIVAPYGQGAWGAQTKVLPALEY